MNEPSVAVLLATFNGAFYCETQIVSILWQRKVDIHIYVRDDGSCDATPGILRAYAERYPDRITIVDSCNISTGSASGNFFTLLKRVDMAQHDYIAFADQDDVWTPDKLTHAIDRLVKERAEGYSSDLIAYSAADNVAWVLRKAGAPADLDYLFQGGSAGCTYVLSRNAAQVTAEVMARVSDFCPNASHDWIIYAICRSRGMKWVHDPTAEILYRQHGSNQYGARQGMKELTAKLRLIGSKWYRDHILWLAHVIVGREDERHVLDAVARGSWADRFWLIRHAVRFRRGRGEVMRLRAAFALRMI